MNRRQQDAAYVAQTIRTFLDGTSGDWDWDDFTSCAFGDPQLDDIRQRAAAVELPAGRERLAVLEELAGEAQRLASG